MNSKILILPLSLLAATLAWAQPITYQGRLDHGSVTADGSFDLRFSLYDANTGGTVLAGPIDRPATTIQDGLFAVELNFDPALFGDGTVWLEIAVREVGGSAFETLAPRQSVTTSPYALHANRVAVDGVETAALQDLSVTRAKLAPASVGASEIDTLEVQRRVTSECATGSAIRSIQADGNIQCQSVPASGWTVDGGFVHTSAQVGIGTSSSSAMLEVRGNSAIGVPQLMVNETEFDFARIYFYSQNGGAHWALAGRTHETDPLLDQFNIFNSRPGAGDALSIRGNGNVGIGVNSPSTQLDINGGMRVRGMVDGSAGPRRSVMVQPNGQVEAGPSKLYLSVPFHAFTPELGNALPRSLSISLGYFRHFDNGVDEVLSAPLSLPDGAEITAATIWFRDEDSTIDLSFRVGSQVLGASPTTLDDVAWAASSGASSGDRSVVATLTEIADQRIINNQVRSYFARVFPVSADEGAFGNRMDWQGETAGLQAVVIEYQL